MKTRQGSFTQFDYQDGNLMFRHCEEVTPVLDQNKAEQNDGDGYTKDRTMRKIASLPMTVYCDLVRRGIMDDEKALRRWLRDPDNRYFRTSGGKI